MNIIKEMMKQAHQSKSIETIPEPVTTPISTPKEEHVPTPIRQIARDDVPVTKYGKKPVATNFNCYNKEVFQWLRTFSSNNQFNGGVAITKSQIVEILLDICFYDLDIKPIGYASQQALREDILNQIRQYT